MKRIILTLFLLVFSPLVYAKPLEGRVSYTVDSARAYVKEGQQDSINISGPFEIQANSVKKAVRSYNNSGDVIGITVEYVNEPTKAYIYNKNGKLIYLDKYDRDVDIYPHRGYRYNLDGKLILTSLTVSQKEMFRFSPAGKLIAHSINGVIYDENGNVIGHGK